MSTALGNIATAQTEYYARPKDERYADLPALIAAARHDRQLSKEVAYNWRDLSFGTHDAGLTLHSPKGAATFSHWSFGQTASMLQSPAAFLRDRCSPEVAAQVLNYRISQQPHGDAPTLLVRAANGEPLPRVRAATSESYARIWDDHLYDAVNDRFGGKLITPPSWDGSPAGCYRGDRDSFVIQVDGGSIVTDPSAANQDGRMYRALMLRNSEVGAAAIKIECILYRYICGNHMLWGAMVDRQFSRRHVGQNALRDTVRELNNIAYRWTTRAASDDERIIRSLINHEIAHTKEAVIDELQAAGWSKQDAEQAYTTCEAKETASPRSYWGIAQGATRNSQISGYQDERYKLDQLAAKLLEKGRKLVAV